MKILSITYLKEYVKTKFNKDIVREAFINPSKEKTSREEVSTEIVLLISRINSEKHIFLLNKISPIPLIERVMLENKSKKISIIKNEKFILIPKIIALKINCIGFSVDL